MILVSAEKQGSSLICKLDRRVRFIPCSTVQNVVQKDNPHGLEVEVVIQKSLRLDL